MKRGIARVQVWAALLMSRGCPPHPIYCEAESLDEASAKLRETRDHRATLARLRGHPWPVNMGPITRAHYVERFVADFCERAISGASS